MLLCFLTLRPPPGSTLFPYTTLFRSREGQLLRRLRPRLIVAHERPLQNRDGAGQHALHWARGLRLRSEEHTSELQSHSDLVCRLLLEKKKKKNKNKDHTKKKQ